MIKTGTLVEIAIENSTIHQLGWVIKKCPKDGGTIVYVIGDNLPYHEVCVKEDDFIQPVKKRGSNFSGEIPL